MSSYPPGSRAAHDNFCVNEKWSLVRDARGGAVKHHRVYELQLYDGRILRTRISRPIDGSDYGQSVWSHILREQLEVSAEEFWACVVHGKIPARGPVRVVPPDKEPIPLGVVEKLIRLAGLAAAEIEGMTKAEAVARLNRYWAEQERE